MISNDIKELIILCESKSSKRRGYVVKNITDTKTWKSKMIKVIRGLDNDRSGSDNRLFDRTQKYNAQSRLKSRKKSRKMDEIYLPDSRGRTHPAIFHHEVGHIMRNLSKTKSSIRDEKEAWQYVKQTKPEIYQQGLKDKMIQNGFGSYVDNARSLRKINGMFIRDSKHKSFREDVPEFNPELNKKGWYQIPKS